MTAKERELLVEIYRHHDATASALCRLCMALASYEIVYVIGELNAADAHCDQAERLWEQLLSEEERGLNYETSNITA